jgi:SAM-dependent methyltransferase
VDKYFDTDIKADAAVLPLPAESVAEIFCSHALEHMGYAEHGPALREWLRVLQPGGKLTVVVPNMDYVATVWLHGGDRHYAEQIMFGGQTREGDYHLSGFRPADIEAALTSAGFTVTRCWVVYDANHHQESICAEAVKP